MVIKDPNRLQPLNRFLNRIKRSRPEHLQEIAVRATDKVWEGVDCLACANCCKSMSPTYTTADIKRIAAFLKISTGELKGKWLKKERGTGNWINKNMPCQFLDLQTNFCSVYDVRPRDCAGFPHLTKKRFIDYVHVHRQNLDECPATFKMVERMKRLISENLESEVLSRKSE
jgi:Fe-S-cluster containining protein